MLTGTRKVVLYYLTELPLIDVVLIRPPSTGTTSQEIPENTGLYFLSAFACQRTAGYPSAGSVAYHCMHSITHIAACVVFFVLFCFSAKVSSFIKIDLIELAVPIMCMIL